ncbi:MAG: hypothetical protein J1G01_00905 [Clostridiales bacterium]|nr:hypothetical protein [Clostridiales bacterium]
MKKRTVAISIALASVLAVSPAVLSGCSGDHYTEIKFAKQDTSYVVTSQGGSAVSYGNYVYFINGTRGFDDTNGNANVWDEVVKGALYRAELSGEKVVDEYDGLTRFKTSPDENGLEFKYDASTDYFDNPLNVVKTTKIAPKTIGTASYTRGGIFIYDNAVYFASPNNEKDKNGTVQTSRTDFFMMPLSGGEPTKIYTTSEKVDTTASAYAFYKYKGAVYLVVNEGAKVISVKVNPSKQDVSDPVTLISNVTSVYFPVRDTYYKGISNNTPEDFIYIVRNVKDGELQRSGTVIEAMRPNGSENFVVSMNGQTESIEAVRDGMVFYRTTVVSDTVMAYTNLHNMLMEYSPSYKKEQEALNEDERTRQIDGTFTKSMLAGSISISATYAFRGDLLSNTVYCVGVASSAMYLYRNDALVGRISPMTGTIQFIQNDYLYFSDSSNNYYRVPLYSNMEGYNPDSSADVEIVASDTSSATSGIKCDYAAGYFVYFDEVDEWANNYTYFYKVDGARMEPQFVGKLAKSDIPTKEQIEEKIKGSSSN